MRTINVNEAKSRFSELLSRTAGGEQFLIRRRQKPVAILVDPSTFAQLERQAQMAQHLAMSLGQSEAILQQIEEQTAHPAMVAFGLLQDETDFDNLTTEILSARQNDPVREEVSFEDIG